MNRGRFLPGNPGGPGNPHGAAMSRFRSLLLDAVTPADLKAIIKAQVAKAKKGDARAAQLILSYTAGAPLPPALSVAVANTVPTRTITLHDVPLPAERIFIEDETSSAAPGDRHTVIERYADGTERVLRDPPDRVTIIDNGPG